MKQILYEMGIFSCEASSTCCNMTDWLTDWLTEWSGAKFPSPFTKEGNQTKSAPPNKQNQWLLHLSTKRKSNIIVFEWNVVRSGIILTQANYFSSIPNIPARHIKDTEIPAHLVPLIDNHLGAFRWEQVLSWIHVYDCRIWLWKPVKYKVIFKSSRYFAKHIIKAAM